MQMVAWPLFNGQLPFSESALAVNTMVRHGQNLHTTAHWLFLSVGGWVYVVPLCLHVAHHTTAYAVGVIWEWYAARRNGRIRYISTSKPLPNGIV